MGKEALISKKDVLEQTGLSYGQFYRWKRMGLIPEQWFVRRSTFTGQETFLPKERTLDRIERVRSLKNDHSLEQIAEMLSPDIVRKTYAAAEVEAMEWVSPRARKLYEPLRRRRGPYQFSEILYLTAIERLLADGQLSGEQVRRAAATLIERFHELPDHGQERFLAVAGRGEASVPAVGAGRCLFDSQTPVVRIDLNRLLEEVKVELQKSLPAKE